MASLRHSPIGRFALMVLVSLTVCAAFGGTKRAIIIGINVYNPPDKLRAELEKTAIAHTFKRKAVPGGWKDIRYKDLNGAVADAELMKGILTSMGVTHIVTLYNEQATADAILSTLENELITNASKDDVRIVYYSGHGSYARNKATSDQDQTIVPADHWRDVPDIRDKELSRILYAAGKKGVIVTMIADSCHSGSLSRGAWNAVGVSKTADGAFTPIEVNDSPDIDSATGQPIDPKDQGVLYIAAAQRNEEAMEYPTDGGTHGAFTWALRQALIQGPNQRVDLVLQRTLSYLNAESRPQQPVMSASAARRGESLLGDSDPVHGLVVAADDVSNGTVTIRGGPAIGIYPDCELKRLDTSKPPLRINVVKTISAASSLAAVVDPADGPVAQGDLFQIEKYVVPSKAMLRVYYPSPAPSSSILALSAQMAKLKDRPGITVLQDATVARPTQVVFWSGETWMLQPYPATQNPIRLGATPNAADILSHLTGANRLLTILPPTPELAASLQLGTKGENTSVQVLPSPAGADYLLEGRMGADGLQYAWILPDSTEESVREQAADSGSSRTSDLMAKPLRSDWIALGSKPDDVDRAAGLLSEKALRLGRIRAWLTLLTPPDPRDSSFPYHLALRDIKTKELVTSGSLKGGSRFKLVLAANQADLKRIGNRVMPRWVYIFAVDHFGKGSLIFPVLGRGNDGNHLPVGPDPKNQNQIVDVSPSIADGKHVMTVSPAETEYDFEVTEPFGVDTYLVLTSEQPVDNPEVFEFEGVRSRGGSRGANIGSPLTELLSDVGTGSRGFGVPRPVPTNWALERLTLRSVPK